MRRIVALIMLSVFLLGCAEEKPEKFECSDTDGTVNPTRAGTVYSYDYRDGITDYCKDNLTLVEYTYERVSFGCLAKPVEINCFDYCEHWQFEDCIGDCIFDSTGRIHGGRCK